MRSLLFAGLLVALAGCDAAAPSPTQADARAASSDGFLVTTFDANGNSSEHRQDKVAVCHYDAETDTYERISVGAPALPAHERHGDGVPGGIVDGADVPSTFGDDCAVVPVQRFTCEIRPFSLADYPNLYTIEITLRAIDPDLKPLGPGYKYTVTAGGQTIALGFGPVLNDSAATIRANSSSAADPMAVLETTGADGTPLACGPYPLYPPNPI